MKSSRMAALCFVFVSSHGYSGEIMTNYANLEGQNIAEITLPLDESLKCKILGTLFDVCQDLPSKTNVEFALDKIDTKTLTVYAMANYARNFHRFDFTEIHCKIESASTHKDLPCAPIITLKDSDGSGLTISKTKVTLNGRSHFNFLFKEGL